MAILLSRVDFLLLILLGNIYVVVLAIKTKELLISSWF
jgi:hypothetical protein